MARKNIQIFIYLMISLVSQNSFADVVAISKDEKAPFSGFLFDKDSATEARNAALDRDRYKLISESLQKTVDLQGDSLKIEEQRVELYKSKTDDMAKELYANRSLNNWERAGFFLLGIIAVGTAGYAISHVR